MKVYLATIGCRLNQSEIETISRQLLANGHEVVHRPEYADKVVVNTCAVTAQAAKDARKLTRRIHRTNNQAELVLTGCYATIAPDELSNVRGVGKIVSNQDKDQIVRVLDPGADIDVPVYDREPVLREVLTQGMGLTRAFVKVQDGCNNRCTFCVTTIARGESRSRRIGDIVAEIQALAAAGYQEVVLTGVHLGSYGKDIDKSLGLFDLVSTILTHTDISRLRLSSLEPWEIDHEFFGLWENPRLLPHLHVPLQSGSDSTLRRMARRTTRASFQELVTWARDAIPELNLSTDLIVGFPGETEADFQSSYDFVREIGFSRLHVFSYSQRPGTAAAEMTNQVPSSTMKKRVRRMLDLGEELAASYHKRYETRTLPVLWEYAKGAGGNGLRWVGYTDNYIRVSATGPADLFNKVTETYLESAEASGISGVILGLNGRTVDD